MAKEFASYRIALENYPHRLAIETQFADMDVHAHINNLAIGRFFESARARLQIQLYAGRKLFQRDADYVILLVENNIHYLAECNFPDPVTVGTALSHIGNSSYQFQHALFQNNICVALCDAVMVCAQQGKPVAIPDDVRTCMQSFMINH